MPFCLGATWMALRSQNVPSRLGFSVAVAVQDSCFDINSQCEKPAMGNAASMALTVLLYASLVVHPGR